MDLCVSRSLIWITVTVGRTDKNDGYVRRRTPAANASLRSLDHPAAVLEEPALFDVTKRR
jgi:hypothetical protein